MRVPKVYAELPRYRTRQVARDLGTALWILVWIWIGTHVHDLVTRLATPGRTIATAGDGFARTLTEAGNNVADLPLVGDTLRGPLDAAGQAGLVLERAGVAQQDAVHTLALWLGVLLAFIPISYALSRYLPGRVRWIREATAASRLRIDAADLHLFALRAVVNQPLWELQRVVSDPAAALHAKDYDALAGLELASLGLNPRPLQKQGVR